MKVKTKYRFGLTILEMMITVAIIGIVLASSFFILARMGHHFKLTGTAMQIKQDVALTRQLALEKNKRYLIRFNTTSTPQRWQIVQEDSAGYYTVVRTDTIPRPIRFGVPSGVTGNGPDGTAIPSDGISFTNNEAWIVPRIGASQRGAIYMTEGRSVRAVYINAIGSATVMLYSGPGVWR